MLNIGGMMHYVRGTGGIILCNLKFQDQRGGARQRGEETEHPRRRSCGTSRPRLPAARSIIAGANLEYHPIDLCQAGHPVPRREGLVRRQAIHLPRPAAPANRNSPACCLTFTNSPPRPCPRWSCWKAPASRQAAARKSAASRSTARPTRCSSCKRRGSTNA